MFGPVLPGQTDTYLLFFIVLFLSQGHPGVLLVPGKDLNEMWMKISPNLLRCAEEGLDEAMMLGGLQDGIPMY